jgi:hypothetical protein
MPILKLIRKDINIFGNREYFCEELEVKVNKQAIYS